MVQALLGEHRQLLRMFEGTGRKGGKTLQSPREYDEEFASRLARYGIHDVEVVAAAVRARPDGYAASQPEGYARDLAAKAVSAFTAAVEEQRAQDAELEARARAYIDFKVDAVRIIKSDVTRFELVIGAEVLVLTAKQLVNMNEFKQAYFNVLHRYPRLPPARGKGSELWGPLVNSFTAMAEVEVLEGNATDEEWLSRVCARAKDAITTGKEADALLHDLAYVENGRRYFTLDAVLERVRTQERAARARDVARALQELGCAYHRNWPIKERCLDVWSEPVIAVRNGAEAGGVE